MNRAPVIAIDFDNTIVNYDDVLHELAFGRNLIDKTVVKTVVKPKRRSPPTHHRGAF